MVSKTDKKVTDKIVSMWPVLGKLYLCGQFGVNVMYVCMYVASLG